MESKPAFRAICEECGKTYKVGRIDRVYNCKVCGGEVKCPTSDAPAPETQGVDKKVICSECGAVSRRGSKFCEECGVALASPERPSSEASDSEPRRSRASGELLKALKWIKLLAGFYWLGAAGSAIETAGYVRSLNSVSESVGSTSLFIVLSTAATVFMIFGAVRLPFQPFFWAVVLASWRTLLVALWTAGAISDGEVVPFLFLLLWGFVLVFWLGVLPMVRVRRLIREFPDLYVARRIQGVQGRRRRKLGKEQSQEEILRLESQVADRTAWKRSAAISGVFVLFVLAGIWSMFSVRPPAIEPRLAEFEKAWRSSQPVEVAKLFSLGASDDRIRSIERLAERRKWNEGYPQLVESDVDVRGESAVVLYDSDVGMFELRWQLERGRWSITGLKPPRR